MMDVLYWAFIFAVSLAILIKSSEYFTLSAEEIGIYFGIPSFVVGVTIVSLGTSLPELVSSVIAVLSDSTEIVTGNVVGSNIANIFLILGIAAIIGKNMKISYELIHVDLPMLFGSAILLTLTLWDGVFTSTEAILAILGAVIYIAYTASSVKERGGKSKQKGKMSAATVGTLIVSGAFIYLGASYTIESVIRLSELLNVGKEIIAITAISIGTSLPELMVSASAARFGRAEIAVGNVLGSNIFNSYLVIGVPALIGPLKVTETIIDLGLPMMVVATFLYFFMTQDREITGWEGMVLILFYVLFLGKLFAFI
ncbi:calcium/sodium antiporter [Candidatus Micrarchaeota archaeon]|nr:calcium/sodium antiporter [Candidatus Micrarchaeota archaeon]